MKLSHLDSRGRVRMVDVSHKAVVRRTAVAAGSVRLAPATVRLLRRGVLAKGDALACARIAGIMAAKRTCDIVPLCHPLPLEDIRVEPTLRTARVDIVATVVTCAKTGVEMEALSAVCGAALAVYDMCKAVDKAMVIGDVRLVTKTKTALQGPEGQR